MTNERFRELEIKYGYEAAKNLRDVSEEVRTKDGKSVADMINEGTRAQVGEFNPIARHDENYTTAKDCCSVADMINQGTIDIIKYPTMEARRAMERGHTLRDLQAKLKGE